MNVGDKVVCVGTNDTVLYSTASSLWKALGDIPVNGTVWVVSNIYVSPTGEIGLILIGSSVIYIPNGVETGWNSKGFRKLDELKEETRQRQLKEQGQAV